VKILLDENTPVQALPILECVLRKHEIRHVDKLKWNSKKDPFLLVDAKQRGFDILITKDHNQLNDPAECSILKKVGIHHVRFGQGEGLAGLARAVAAVVAAMPAIMAELELADGQRLIKVTGLGGGTRRHTTTDPSKNPPPYWPH
jgi:hypothetical protein